MTIERVHLAAPSTPLLTVFNQRLLVISSQAKSPAFAQDTTFLKHVALCHLSLLPLASLRTHQGQSPLPSTPTPEPLSFSFPNPLKHLIRQRSLVFLDFAHGYLIFFLRSLLLTLIDHFLCGSHCGMCFICLITLNHHSCLVRQMIVLSLLYGQVDPGSES